MNRRAAIYITGLALAAVPLLQMFGNRLEPHDWPGLLGLTVATVAFVMFRIEAPTGQSMTLNAAVDTVAILMGGPALGVWVAALGQLVSGMINRNDYYRVVFNMSQKVVTISVAGWAFQLVGGHYPFTNLTAIPPLAFITVYLLVNTLLIATLFYFLQGKPLMKIWADMLKQGWESYLMVQAIGLLATLVVVYGGIQGIGLLLGLLVLLQRLLSSYYRALRDGAATAQRQQVQESLLKSLVAAMDARDVYTSGHSDRVAQYAELIAKELGLSPAAIHDIKHASLLHDIGKIGIPDAILRKPGPLTPLERSIMMEHPTRGIQILKQVPNVPELVLLAVKHHHEWYNGGGYPDGLAAGEIPVYARIIGVADALDAMTSARSYRAGMPWHEALNRLRQGRGTQFDPQAVDALLRVDQANPDLSLELAKKSTPTRSAHDILEEQGEGGGRTGRQAGRILPVDSKELRILYQMALERRSLLDLSQTLHRVLEILYDTVGEHLYYVMLLEEDTGKLVVRSAAGSAVDITGEGWYFHDCPSTRVAETGNPSVVGDLHGNNSVNCIINPGTRSVVTIPLVSEGRTMGILRVESSRSGAFGDDEAYLLTAVAGQLADAIEVAKVHERMAYAATHDDLTQLLNRSAFFRHLAGELERAKTEGYPVAVAVLDLNDFKSINDQYGHLAGDDVVRTFGERLRSCFEDTGMVARYGGDEFAILLPGVSRAEAARLIAAVAESTGFEVTAGEVKISVPTASWGVAAYPESGSEAELLIAAADQLMYQRKRAQAVDAKSIA